MSLTLTQQRAVNARGNVLVVAGAGTGKTHTLVERVLKCLLQEELPTSLDEILMVTFTEATATDMRKRIRERLEKALEEEKDKSVRRRSHLEEQLALFDLAHIGTLHSFCLQLVRQHFYSLELDPQLAVLAEEEAHLLAHEELDNLLEQHYAGKGKDSAAVQQIIQNQGRGTDDVIRSLILKLHHYTQTRQDPAGWFRAQMQLWEPPSRHTDTFAQKRRAAGKSEYKSGGPESWEKWLLQAFDECCKTWTEFLPTCAPSNAVAAECRLSLGLRDTKHGRAGAAEVLNSLLAAFQNCQKGKKTEWLVPLREMENEVKFLVSLMASGDGIDPLVEDWKWVGASMATLLRLAQDFEQGFTASKRELGMVDFHDLEQYALRLLWDFKAGEPTAIARQWRQKFRFVFVDEYQDINAAQDKIIEALSREHTEANRFLVGDIKQSIYRFRLADPRIFQKYIDDWEQSDGPAKTAVIPLVENFRSREGILDFINSLFPTIMQSAVGGVEYDERARLKFGAADEREKLSAADRNPCVELHLRIKGFDSIEEAGDAGAEKLNQLLELADADKEARIVALRLRELKAGLQPVWDEKLGQFRPVEWQDMAILLRSPTNKAESYAKEFSRLDVPLHVARGGFYQSAEILDLLSLLKMLDNPLQDIPTIAVLHSPLVGLTLNELAEIRLACKGVFWLAIAEWHKSKVQKSGNAKERAGSKRSGISQSLMEKVESFLARFSRWRRLARQVSLSRCLEAVLSETHYASWLLTQPRGEQRYSNVQRLVSLAQKFDQFQRQGLFRFLLFIEAQQLAETEPEGTTASESQAVRLMSIHQSKGLEFPVVVVGDMGKAFNLADLQADIILDEEYGLCPQIKPPKTSRRYPSLPYWLARRRQRRELLGEELRLLYVAMTRARDVLILSGAITAPSFARKWREAVAITDASIATARSYADWLGLWFSHNVAGQQELPPTGQNSLIRWNIHNETRLLESGASLGSSGPEGESFSCDPASMSRLQQRLSWKYPYATATCKPAKTSVSVVRRRAAEQTIEEEQSFLFQSRNSPAFSLRHSEQLPRPGQSAADLGSLHHTFLQLVSLEQTGSLKNLQNEGSRLVREGAMEPEQIELLDLEGIAAFWSSDLGRRIRVQSQYVRRELPFTFRLQQNELDRLLNATTDESLRGEFVVVQGIADLVVLLPEEIWIVDFKTDRISIKEIPERARLYEPQLKLYSLALSRIYSRPVTDSSLYFLGPRKCIGLSQRV